MYKSNNRSGKKLGYHGWDITPTGIKKPRASKYIKRKFSHSGYDQFGYDVEGYSRAGFNIFGKNRLGQTRSEAAADYKPGKPKNKQLTKGTIIKKEEINIQDIGFLNQVLGQVKSRKLNMSSNNIDTNYHSIESFCVDCKNKKNIQKKSKREISNQNKIREFRRKVYGI